MRSLFIDANELRLNFTPDFIRVINKTGGAVGCFNNKGGGILPIVIQKAFICEG